jgi:hypothetical protein
MAKKDEPKKTQADYVREAFDKALEYDRLVIKPPKGIAFPLLSEWEVYDYLYRVVGVYEGGSVELVKVNK